MLLSFLSQIQSVPKDYSITYVRRWMAIHMANNVDYLWVIFFSFNTFTTCIFLEKSNIETSNLYTIIMEKSHILYLKSLTHYTVRFSLKKLAQQVSNKNRYSP